MAYGFTNSKGVTYYLHNKKQITKTGKERTLFFFSKEIKEGALDAVPDAYQVVEMKTGLPVLKKKESINQNAGMSSPMPMSTPEPSEPTSPPSPPSPPNPMEHNDPMN